MLKIKRSPVLYLENCAIAMLPLDPIRKWLCYFVLYGHGKLDVRFVHGRAEKCIENGADIIGRKRREK